MRFNQFLRRDANEHAVFWLDNDDNSGWEAFGRELTKFVRDIRGCATDRGDLIARVVQELCIRCWKKQLAGHDFKSVDGFVRFLADSARKQSRKPPVSRSPRQLIGGFEPASRCVADQRCLAPIDSAAQTEVVEAVRMEVIQLPENQRLVVELHDFVCRRGSLQKAEHEMYRRAKCRLATRLKHLKGMA